MSLQHYIDRYFVFSKQEITDFLSTSVISAFVVFFFIWRTTDFSFFSGVVSFLGILVLVLGSMFVFIASAKIIAISRNYTAHYKGWITASLIGFVVAFTTYGFVPVLFPGIVEIEKNSRMRHGKVFSGENRYDIFTVLAGALLVQVFLTVFFNYCMQ